MKSRQAANQVRIIAGTWRGRRLSFDPVPGLRPTPDRVRETLFNWLMLWLPGKRCLDLFAGTGAVGVEALSRGARHCTFIEDAAEARGVIRRNMEALGLNGVAKILRRDAEGVRFESTNGFYNRRRRPSALGWKSPLALERKAA